MSEENFIYEWVINDGGPFLLMSKKLLPYWEGIEPPKNGREVTAKFRYDPTIPATDYDRACDVEGYLGIIDVGDGKALVLGDAEMMTTWLERPDGGVLVRWHYAETELEIIDVANSIPFGNFEYSGLSINFADTDLILMSACDSEEEFIYNHIFITLQSGVYEVYSYNYDDGVTATILHYLHKTE